MKFKVNQTVQNLRDIFLSFLKYKRRIIFNILLIFLIFVFLQIPFIAWMLFSNPYTTCNSPGVFTLYYKNIFIKGPLTLRHIFNLPGPEGTFDHYQLFTSLLFAIGFVLLAFKRSAKALFFIGLFLVYFFVNSSMESMLGDLRRKCLMYDLPYSIIAAYPLIYIRKRKALALSLLLFFVITTSPIPFWGLLKSFTLFKDARIEKKFNLKGQHRDVGYFLAIAKTPNDCLVITSKHMIATNDYFYDNQREIVDIYLIHPDRHDLFLKYLREKIKNGKEVLYFEDVNCFHESLDFACRFIDRYFIKLPLFSQPKGDRSVINVYRLGLRTSFNY